MKAREVFMYALGSLIVLLICGLCYVVFTIEMPDANHDIGLMLIGALVGQFIQVVNYFYGSSKGSSDKNDMLKGAK